MDKNTAKEFILLTKQLDNCEIGRSIKDQKSCNIELIPLFINEGLYDVDAIKYKTSGGKVWLHIKHRQEFLTLHGREELNNTKTSRLRRWLFQIITTVITVAATTLVIKLMN